MGQMKNRLVLGIAAVLALSACGGQTTTTAASSSTAAPAATSSATQASSSAPTAASSSAPVTSSAASMTAPSGPGAVPAKGEKPTREFVIGKWGTDGDCMLAIDLRPDGSSDGPFGNWAYSDGVISFPEEPDFKVNVTVVDDNTMESTNATSDKTSRMTRCP